MEITLSEAYEDLLVYMQENIPVMLWSAPGIGKSSIVKQAALYCGFPLIDFRASLADPVDLRGIPDVQDGFTRWMRPHFLPLLERDGAKGVVFFDEINNANMSMQAACYQWILDNRIGEHDMPEGWRRIAAGNRQSDRAAAQRMPSALANRMAHLDIRPDAETAAQWFECQNLHPALSAFFRYRPEFVHKMSDEKSWPSPRQWEQVNKILHYPRNRTFRLVRELVGEDASIEFVNFLEVYETLPPIPEIIANPETARIPDPNQIALTWAICAALSRLADRSNIEAVIKYTDRLEKDYSTMAVAGAARRTPAVQETRAFVEWATRNPLVN